MQDDFKHILRIPEFFSNKQLFITGGTGFLGKVLIDKLLRSCPDIGKIYILVREKKGKKMEERIEDMLKDQLFDTLKNKYPDAIKSKLIPIQGDCSQINLGLSEADRTLLKNSINIIFHVAASVRFDDHIKDAILLNTRGTREMCQLARDAKNLEIFVHVSTTYCNSVVGKELDEIIYPAMCDWRKSIEIAESCDRQLLGILQDKYLGPYPNTYTFTKALGEHVVQDLCTGVIPTLICRPSIVISTLNDPVKGWIDNFNGPVGLMVACGKGLLRCSYQNPDINADYIPVDIVVKGIIVATWDMALRGTKKLQVIQCSNSYHIWMTLGETIKFGRDLSLEIPLNDSLWVPKGFVSNCRYWAYFNTIFFHLIPAFFFDIVLRLAGKKPIVARLQMKIYNAALQLRYFTMQEWRFKNDTLFKNMNIILDADRKDWEYDFRNVDAVDYLRHCMYGARKYLLKEFEDTLPQAKVHYRRMYWLDKVAMFLLYSSLVWFVLYLNIIETVFNSTYDFLYNV